jgi:tetratricopeptide (TPR) repeat protein
MDAILDTESLVERAEYQFKIHDYRRALADLNEAATRDPIASTINATGAARHHSPGAVLYRLGRYQEAIRFLERGAASAVPSECVTDLFCLAMSYHRAGEPTRAKATFERALRAQAECPIDESNMRELASTRSEAEALLFGRR